MKLLRGTLGLFKLRVVAFPQAVAATIVSTGGPFSCEPSPTQDLLPDVIAPRAGTSPAWLVDGHTMWPGALEPVKTVWVLRRSSSRFAYQVGAWTASARLRWLAAVTSRPTCCSARIPVESQRSPALRRPTRCAQPY